MYINMLFHCWHAKICLENEHSLIFIIFLQYFCFFYFLLLSTLHFYIMQYRRAKKITAISTKYIFRTIKGCSKNASHFLSITMLTQLQVDSSPSPPPESQCFDWLTRWLPASLTVSTLMAGQKGAGTNNSTFYVYFDQSLFLKN